MTRAVGACMKFETYEADTFDVLIDIFRRGFDRPRAGALSTSSIRVSHLAA